MSYTTLAEYLSVDRSAMMRELKNLADEGIIERDGIEEEETRTPTTQLSLPPQSSASTNSAISPDDTENILCAQNRTRTCTSLNTRT